MQPIKNNACLQIRYEKKAPHTSSNKKDNHFFKNQHLLKKCLPVLFSSKKHRKKRRHNTIGGGCPGADVWLERGLEDRPTYSQGDSTPHTKGEKISTLRAHTCTHSRTHFGTSLSHATLLAAVVTLLCMPWRILKRLMPQVCVRAWQGCMCVCVRGEGRGGRVCVCVCVATP